MKFSVVNAVLLLVLIGISIPQESPQSRLRLAADVAEGNLLSKVEPAYPQMAKIAHVEGDVVLSAYIGKTGLIENLRAVSGHPLLIQSAMDAVRQWKYKPYMVNGEPVAVETTVTVKYRMPGSAATPRKLRISSGVANDNKISGTDPDYPLEAKRQHIQGDVLLRIIIDERGNVADALVTSGDPILAEAAVSAVKTWKYKPWLLNGEPVTVEAPVTIRFHM